MVDVEGNPRKISVSLYLAALLISAIIFAAGIFLGKALERGNLDSISANVDAANIRASSLEIIYLAGDSPEFCPVYREELSSIDAQTEQLGYMLSYIEDQKGASDPALKKKYFMLEATAFLLSQKVSEKCGVNYSTILYFYSNSNCTDCNAQGRELLEAKKKLGEKVRIYSFDGDLGSSIANALKSKYGVRSYPSIAINGKNATGGFKDKDWIAAALGSG